MIYQSISDIYAANETVRRQLTTRVETLSEAQQTFRPTEGAWSIAEIVEHLSILEQSMVRLIGMLLNKAESASAAATSDAPTGDDAHVANAPAAAAAAAAARPFKPFSLDALVETIRDKKLTAPEQVRPGGQMSLADSLANLQRTRATVESFRPRLEAADLEAATYPHPAFGDFNLSQWLAFIGHHEARHLRQIESLMAAPGFANNNGD